MVFPVVTYGCESWTIRKAEHQRIDAFELWRWRTLLRAPWTARRSNQSILKEISPEHSLEGLMLKLKTPVVTWCEELTHLKRPWCWERLKVGEGDDRGWDGWMASLTQRTWVWVNSRSWWWTGRPGLLQSMGSQRAGHDWVTELNLNSSSMVHALCQQLYVWRSVCSFVSSHEEKMEFAPWHDGQHLSVYVGSIQEVTVYRFKPYMLAENVINSLPALI